MATRWALVEVHESRMESRKELRLEGNNVTVSAGLQNGYLLPELWTLLVLMQDLHCHWLRGWPHCLEDLDIRRRLSTQWRQLFLRKDPSGVWRAACKKHLLTIVIRCRCQSSGSLHNQFISKPLQDLAWGALSVIPIRDMPTIWQVNESPVPLSEQAKCPLPCRGSVLMFKVKIRL